MLVEWFEGSGKDALPISSQKTKQTKKPNKQKIKKTKKKPKTKNQKPKQNDAYLKILPVIDLIAALICMLK